MRFSLERIEELKQVVRVELVKHPSASIYRIQRALEDLYNHSFDKNFVAKLKRKVHRERATLFNEDIYAELGHLQQIVVHARQVLVEIILDEENRHKSSDKIRAFQALTHMEATLFYAKLNAGIYKEKEPKAKKLTAKERAEIDEIIGLLLRNSRWRKVENGSQN